MNIIHIFRPHFFIAVFGVIAYYQQNPGQSHLQAFGSSARWSLDNIKPISIKIINPGIYK